jgi:hypothetical protein
MRILTIKQPWAHAIIFGGKDVENRTWSTAYRGPVAIHAGMSYDEAGRDVVVEAPPATLIDRGVIIGVTHLVDVVRDSPSAWAEQGEDVFHWVLANPMPLRVPIAFKGALGLTRITPEMETSIWSAVPQPPAGPETPTDDPIPTRDVFNPRDPGDT